MAEPDAPIEHAPSMRAPEGQDRQGWKVVNFSKLLTPPDAFAGFVIAVGLLAALFLVATTVLLLVRTFTPVWTSADITGDHLRNLLIAIGAVVAAPFAIWKIIVSHWAARAAQEQARIAQEQAGVALRQASIAEENIRTTLFSKAVEQLGATREMKTSKTATSADGTETIETETQTAPNLEVRLGAIYALERIAAESERDHWAIMETLCAYIRHNAPRTTPKDISLEKMKEKYSQHPEFHASPPARRHPSRTHCDRAQN